MSTTEQIRDGTTVIVTRGTQPSVRSITVLVLSTLLAYWASVLAAGFDIHFPWLRQISGIVLLVLLPGVLAYPFVTRGRNQFGVFLLYSVGLGLLSLSLLNIFLTGIHRVIPSFTPFSSPFLPILLSFSVVTMLGIVQARTRKPYPPLPQITTRDVKWGVTLLCLPVLAILAAYAMNRSGQNTLMILTVIVIGIAVLFSLSVPKHLYPVLIFALSAATILHRNLLTSYAIGADIQLTYYLAKLIASQGYWNLDIGGSLIALPMVTALPALSAIVTDLSLSMVYKGVFSLVYSLSPVGMYYLFKDVFDAKKALFGSELFLFYHLTFIFTPGKQRISEFFIILMLLALFLKSETGPDNRLLVAAFAFGTIQSHYASTLIYFYSLFGAMIALAVYLRIREIDKPKPITVSFAAILILSALGWYHVTSDVLMSRFLALPPEMLKQLGHVIALNFDALGSGTGTGVAQQQWGFFRDLKLYLYALIGVIILYGLFELTLDELMVRETAGANQRYRAEFVALAVPLCAFLGSAAFVIADLDVDRVYQICLLFLAPLVPEGIRQLQGRIRSLRPGWPRRVTWKPVLGLVIALLLLNTGFLPYFAGAPSELMFDEDTQDFAYTDAEWNGGIWLKDHARFERQQPTENFGRGTSPPNEDPIYANMYVLSMYRAHVPPAYYNVTITSIKDERTNELRSSGGYTVVRQRDIAYDMRGGGQPLDTLSVSDYERLNRRSNKVYSSGDIAIFENGPSDGSAPD